MLKNPKRKNDDISQSEPGSFLFKVMIALGVIIIGSTLWTLRDTRSPFSPSSQFPSTPLLYAIDEHYSTLNLQTGERAKAQRPWFTAPKESPADILVVQSLIDKQSEKIHEPLTPSPDGQWLAGWTYTADGQGKLMLYDRYGQGRSRSLGIFGIIYWGAQVRWSADSQWVIFSTCVSESVEGRDSSRGRCNDELWTIAIPTGETKRLTDNTFRDSDPDFSPDTMSVVYSSNKDNQINGYSRLYIRDMVTGADRLLTPNLYAHHPVWSPDGTWIAFVVYNLPDLHSQIWIIRPNGQDAQPVSESGGGYEDEAVEWLREQR